MVTTGARGNQILQLVLDIQFHFADGGMDDAAAAFALLHLELEAVLGADLLGDRFLDGLVDVRENPRLHQVGNDLEWLLLELVGQFAHHDRWLDRDDRSIGGKGGLCLRALGWPGFWGASCRRSGVGSRNRRHP